MQIKMSSFAYKLVYYTYGQLPDKAIVFIFAFLFSICLLPLTHSLYVIMYLTKNTRFGEWDDFRNGFFAGSFTSIGVFILGGLVCTLFGFEVPTNEWLKISIIYGVGMVSMLVLVAIIRFLHRKISNIKFKDVKYTR